MKCDRCSNEAIHIQIADPFYKEVNDEIKLVNYCDDCYSDSVDSI